MKSNFLKSGVLFFLTMLLFTSCAKESVKKQDVRTDVPANHFEEDLLFYLTMLNEKNHLLIREDGGMIQTTIVAEMATSDSKAIE